MLNSIIDFVFLHRLHFCRFGDGDMLVGHTQGKEGGRRRKPWGNTVENVLGDMRRRLEVCVSKIEGFRRGSRTRFCYKINRTSHRELIQSVVHGVIRLAL